MTLKQEFARIKAQLSDMSDEVLRFVAMEQGREIVDRTRRRRPRRQAVDELNALILAECVRRKFPEYTR